MKFILINNDIDQINCIQILVLYNIKNLVKRVLEHALADPSKRKSTLLYMQ